jgi:signal transduction histidine kinase
MPWGTHLCLFYETEADLLGTMVPYFAAGLEQREVCFWLYAPSLTPAMIGEAFRRTVPEFDRFLEEGTVILQPAREWYLREGILDVQALRVAWTKLGNDARERGFDGVRVAGCTSWVHEAMWNDFRAYERDFENAVADMPMVVLCAYPLATTGAAGILDVAHAHQLALAKRDGEWEAIETPALRLKQLDRRSRQQSAVAQLGVTAMRARNLDTLLQEAVSLASGGLGTGRAIVWELRRDRRDILLRAHVGWDDLPAGATVPLADGSIAEYVITNEQPIIVGDLSNDTRFATSWLLRDYKVATILTTVIRGREQPWGLLTAHSLVPRAFSEDDIEFLQSMANVLALAIEREHADQERLRLLATAESALAKLHAIQSITDDAIGRMKLDDLLGEVLARLRNTLGADHALVTLLDEERSSLTIRAIDGFPKERVAGVRVPLTTPISGQTIKAGRPLIFPTLPEPDAPEWQSWTANLGVHLRSAMGAPLVVEGNIIGAVVVTSLVERTFTEDELDLLRVVADRVAPAIERCRLVEKVRSKRELLKSLSRRLLTVQEEERRRLSTELHDELGQLLTAIQINIGSTPPRLADAVENINRAMKSVRDLAHELRPAMLDDLGLSAAIRSHADRFAQQTGLKLHLAVEAVPPLDRDVATACFRVAQEALTNVARHASAKNVWLSLRASASMLELSVRDDGAGFDLSAVHERAVHGASLGVLGMQERVSFAGGSIDIRTKPGHGTEVSVHFPLGGPV